MVTTSYTVHDLLSLSMHNITVDEEGVLKLQDRKMTDNITGPGNCRTGN